MKHTKMIQPTDYSELPANTLPDRSNLSKLYVSAKDDRLRQEKSTTDTDSEEGDSEANVTIINRTLVSLLLTIPLMATYLAAIYISWC